MTALYHFFFMNNHVVTKIVETKFVICTVSNVSGICLTSFTVVKFVNNKSDTHTKITVNFSHPLTVTLSQVVVDSDDMHTPACQSVQIGGKGGHQGFALAGFHLGNPSLMKNNTTDNLYIEVFHSKYTPACLTHYRKCLRKKIIKCFAVFKSFLKLRCLGF